MNVWAYTLVRNEETMVRYWARYYRAFCERVIVYDESSSDQTSAVASAEGAEVRQYFGSEHLDDLAFIAFAQQTYPEARSHADWVIWTDVDEIVWHRNLIGHLTDMQAQGVTALRTEGYCMLAAEPPSGPGQITDLIRRGIPVKNYAKVAVFRPELDVRWTPGKHDADIRDVRWDDGSDPIKLLHYRWLGDAWFRARNERNYNALNQVNRERLHGLETYPDFFGYLSPQWFVGQTEVARDVVC